MPLLVASLLAQFTAVPAPEWDALFDRTSGWTGADGIYSIPLDGSEAPGGVDRTDTVFVFGDTFIGDVLPDGRRANAVLVNDTMAWLPAGGFPDGIRFHWGEENGAPAAAVVPDTPHSRPGEWYWFADGIAHEGGLALFAQRMRRTEAGGPFGFARSGLALLLFAAPEGGRFRDPVQLEVPFHLPATGTRGEVTFGQALTPNTAEAGAPHPDGWLYVYGLQEDPLVKKLVAARVAPADLARFDAWRFWNGARWVADPRRAAVLTGRVSSEFSVTPIGDRFLLVYQEDTLSRRIVGKWGDTPVGPFGPAFLLYECPVPDQPAVFTYNAKAHPHLSEPGELLVSYNVNAWDFWDHFRYADVYRPRFVRIVWNGGGLR